MKKSIFFIAFIFLFTSCRETAKQTADLAANDQAKSSSVQGCK